MRKLLRSLVVLCLVLSSVPGRAQTSVDPRALRPLAPGAAAPEPRPRPAAPAAAATPRKSPVRGAVPGKPPARPLPVVPPAPPAAPVVPPPIAVPVRPAPAPSPVPVVPNAPGVATVIPHGQRITFGEGGSDLNPDTEAAIRNAVHSAAPGPNTTFTVSAYAAGTPEDPSTPRRLSLARALAVRSVLIAEGIPSVRIYVKALGATTAGFADGPPDRVDIVVAAPVEPVPVPAAVPMPPAEVPMPPPSVPASPPAAATPKPPPARPARR